MKIVQTFWSGPTAITIDTLLSARGGWLSCEYHWMSWALSCLQAKSVFGAVNLVTDNRGREILVDKLQLPYASVSTELQDKLSQYPASLWALAKIYTYSIQTGPFLHLDGDVYLWDKPSTDLLNSRLISQNLDKNLPFYAEILKAINECFSFVPEIFSTRQFHHEDLYASNAGLLGGHDLHFFREYCRRAFEFIDNNLQDLEKIKGGGLNFIFEQYLFCRLAAEYQIPVSYFKGMVDNPVFRDFIRFEDYPNVQMVHPVGGFKQYPHVCDHLAKKLRKDYPEYYYRIIDLLRGAGVPMRSRIYTLPGFRDNAASLQARHPVTNGNADSSTFIRTRAAISYLNDIYFSDARIDVKDNIKPEDIDKVISRLNRAADKKRLLEIYKVETKRDSLLKKTFKSTAAVNRIYGEDVSDYQQIQNTFSLPREQLLQATVTVRKGYAQLRVGWDWKYDYLKDISTIVERNFSQKRVPQKVILLPDILQADIKEYYPDDLDNMLFETLKKPFTITLLLTEMKQQFNEEEINDDPKPFENLIINTVKRLLYFGLLKINLH